MMHLEVALHVVDPTVPIALVLLEREPYAAGSQPQFLTYLLER